MIGSISGICGRLGSALPALTPFGLTRLQSGIAGFTGIVKSLEIGNRLTQGKILLSTRPFACLGALTITGGSSYSLWNAYARNRDEASRLDCEQLTVSATSLRDNLVNLIPGNVALVTEEEGALQPLSTQELQTLNDSFSAAVNAFHQSLETRSVPTPQIQARLDELNAACEAFQAELHGVDNRVRLQCRGATRTLQTQVDRLLEILKSEFVSSNDTYSLEASALFLNLQRLRAQLDDLQPNDVVGIGGLTQQLRTLTFPIYSTPSKFEAIKKRHLQLDRLGGLRQGLLAHHNNPNESRRALQDYVASLRQALKGKETNVETQSLLSRLDGVSNIDNYSSYTVRRVARSLDKEVHNLNNLNEYWLSNPCPNSDSVPNLQRLLEMDAAYAKLADDIVEKLNGEIDRARAILAEAGARSPSLEGLKVQLNQINLSVIDDSTDQSPSVEARLLEVRDLLPSCFRGDNREHRLTQVFRNQLVSVYHGAPEVDEDIAQFSFPAVDEAVEALSEALRNAEALELGTVDADGSIRHRVQSYKEYLITWLGEQELGEEVGKTVLDLVRELTDDKIKTANAQELFGFVLRLHAAADNLVREPGEGVATLPPQWDQSMFPFAEAWNTCVEEVKQTHLAVSGEIENLIFSFDLAAISCPRLLEAHENLSTLNQTDFLGSLEDIQKRVQVLSLTASNLSSRVREDWMARDFNATIVADHYPHLNETDPFAFHLNYATRQLANCQEFDFPSAKMERVLSALDATGTEAQQEMTRAGKARDILNSYKQAWLWAPALISILGVMISSGVYHGVPIARSLYRRVAVPLHVMNRAL